MDSWIHDGSSILRRAEDLMPRDIMSSEPRHWMVFGQLVMPVQCTHEPTAYPAKLKMDLGGVKIRCQRWNPEHLKIVPGEEPRELQSRSQAECLRMIAMEAPRTLKSRTRATKNHF